MYSLTPEGKRYLEIGLPEKRLLALLDKKKKIADLQRMEDFSIGLQWAKAKGWIKINEGVISRNADPAHLDYPEMKGLKAIERGEEVPNKYIAQSLLDILLKRRLVKKETEDILKRAESQLSEAVANPTPELIATGLWKKASFKPFNVSATGKSVHLGKKQPYNQFLSLVRRRLLELGFTEVRGEAIVTEFWNFDALYQPQDHPSRDWTETYSLRSPAYGQLPDKQLVEKVKKAHERGVAGSTGWGYLWSPKKASRLMPIAHDTAMSAKMLSSKQLKVPGKYFQVVRCYRPDVLDATHLIEFNQVGGFIVDKSLTFRNLLGVLEMFAKEIAGAKQVKFLPDYYPFTEPSVQMSARHPQLGWVEFGGAGIFREEMTKPLGVEEPVIAWGIGVDRLAMFRLGIKDIRHLFSTDLKWLREARMVV